VVQKVVPSLAHSPVQANAQNYRDSIRGAGRNSVSAPTRNNRLTFHAPATRSTWKNRKTLLSNPQLSNPQRSPRFFISARQQKRASVYQPHSNLPKFNTQATHNYSGDCSYPDAEDCPTVSGPATWDPVVQIWHTSCAQT